MDVNRWLITGLRGAGKTTFCQHFIQYARQKGWDTAGILSIGRYDKGEKVGIDAFNIRSGEQKVLGSLTRQSKTDLVIGSWFFDQDCVAWGNLVLLECCPCQVLIVDELGPLEFRQSAGWTQAFDVIQGGMFRLAMVVIRPELIEEANGIFHPTQTIEVNAQNTAERIIQQYAQEWQEMMGN